MKHYNLIVAGGGFTGTFAALAAAREGRSVLLFDKSGFLGGAAGVNYVNPFMRYWENEYSIINRGLFIEVLNRLNAMGGLSENKYTFNEEYLKLILDDLTDEYGVDVLFRSYLTGVEREGGKIKAVLVHNKSGCMRLTADYFIDATGDADLCAESGCSFHLGREEDSKCQPQTLCFRIAGIDVESFFKKENRLALQALYKQAQADGRIKNPRENILCMQHTSAGVVHFNSTRVTDHCPVDAVRQSAAEKLARRQMYELFLFLRENSPACRNATLLSSAPEIGTRESRMIDGLYTVTASDLLDCVDFPDAIAVGNYEVDIHNPDGSGTVIKHVKAGCHYQIPYRALLPVGMDNLMAAGRCISSTHEAQSAYRIMPICASIGEAAGIAAGICSRDGKSLPDADIDEIHRLMDKYDLLYN